MRHDMKHQPLHHLLLSCAYTKPLPILKQVCGIGPIVNNGINGLLQILNNGLFFFSFPLHMKMSNQNEVLVILRIPIEWSI